MFDWIDAKQPPERGFACYYVLKIKGKAKPYIGYCGAFGWRICDSLWFDGLSFRDIPEDWEVTHYIELCDEI